MWTRRFPVCVDGLLYVDLRETDPKILNRFIGTQHPANIALESAMKQERFVASLSQAIMKHFVGCIATQQGINVALNFLPFPCS